MKAVIMAGGEGTRLRPITENIPKPLAEIGGIPVIEHIFALLRRHGISEAAITTRYLSEKIEEKCGTSYSGSGGTLSLTYLREDSPLGTAGSVKSAEKIYAGSGPFLVISGDAMTDIDISAMLAFHKSRGARVTIALSGAADPREYGTVLCRSDGTVSRFIEKPAWQHVLTDAVNTGIYIIEPSVMDYLREGEKSDFARDLFPLLLKNGEKICGFESDAHWCDIGSLTSYYEENMRVSEGKSVFSCGGNISAAESAVVSASVIYSGVQIGKNAVISDSVICADTVIEEGVTVSRGCVIGPRCRIGKGAFLLPGSVLRSSSTVPAGHTYGSRHGADSVFTMSGGGIIGNSDVISCTELGLSIAAAAGKRRIGIVSGSEAAEHIGREAMLCGLSAGGCRAYDFGDGSDAMASFAAVRLGMDYMLSLRISEEDPEKMQVKVYDRSGLYPSRSFERALSAELGGAGGAAVHAECISDIERCSDLEAFYRAALIREGSESRHSSSLPKAPFTFFIDGGTHAETLAHVLRELGFKDASAETAEVYAHIDEGGTSLSVTDRRNGGETHADMWHVAAALTLDEIKYGNITNIALPFSAPLGIERIASDGKITVARYGSCPADSSEDDIRRSSCERLWLRDASFAAVRLFLILGEGISLQELIDEIPDFCCSEQHIEASDREKILVMRSLGVPESEGIRIDHGKSGCVRVIPECGSSLRVIADASSTEAAAELMELSLREIRSLTGEKKQK